MAETSPDRSPARSQSTSVPEYWCYSCDKRVSVETLADLHDVVCSECKNGFVEPISAPASGTLSQDARADSQPVLRSNFGDEFIRMLRLITLAAREEDAPPPPPPRSDPYWWGNGNGDEEVDEEDDRSVIVQGDGDDARDLEQREIENGDGSDGEDEGEGSEVGELLGGENDEEQTRRRQRDVLRLRLRNFATRAASRRNRILDWADILMGLEDHSIDLRLQIPEIDTYVGNPEDYVDAAGYEALLQNLAESDGGKGGAPPAAKAAVEGLGIWVIDEKGKALECSICKDMVNVGDIAKKLPCGHGYHGDCIVPWLGSRNSCPVCRFELPTDDLEYEEERRKRVVLAGLSAAPSSSSGSSGSSSFCCD